jgi:hypothetical protein
MSSAEKTYMANMIAESFIFFIFYPYGGRYRNRTCQPISEREFSKLLSHLATHLPILERLARIELASEPWQGPVLPFNYSRMFGGSGEIRTHGPFRIGCFQGRCNKPDSATLPYLVPKVGFEPTRPCF